jgi:ubiquinone/menaquinone biosynthesis C-methylase UbiE
VTEILNNQASAPPSGLTAELDLRQHRERAYHEAFAQRHSHKKSEPVPLDVIEPGPRRPWNGYWTTYDLLMTEGLHGKRVMIPGCGFGEDAIRVAKLGAEVYAFDLSPDLLEIARQRAALMGVNGIHFDSMPAETLSYPDNFFDIVFFNDILHHVDIAKSVAESKRVIKPGGRVIANELYTHSLMQRVRESRLVTGFLYRLMVKFIYGTTETYITEDEHKIDEHELALLEAVLRPGSKHYYFLFLAGRLFPAVWVRVAKFDRAVFAAFPAFGRLLAGRILIDGTIEK